MPQTPSASDPLPPARDTSLDQAGLESPPPENIGVNVGEEALDQAVAAPKPVEETDAGRGEIMLYAVGNIESSISNKFFEVLETVLVVAMHINPMLLGLIIGIKTFWDAITDPIMAYITDNTRSRWGRRRPYILVGGVTRIAMLVLAVAFFPRPASLVNNLILDGYKKADEVTELTRQTTEELLGALTAASETGLNAKRLERAIAGAAPAKVQAIIDRYRPAMEAYAAEKTARAAARQAELAQAGTTLSTDEQVRRERDIELDTNAARETSAKVRLFDLAAARVRLNEQLAGLAREVASGTRPAAAALAEAQAAVAALAQEETATAPASTPAVKPKPAGPQLGMFGELVAGWRAFWAAENGDQRGVVLYVLLVMLLFTSLTTMQSVPYYALGIELAPSYDGRTRVVTYRSIMDKIAGLTAPWVPVFCFLPLFATALDGLFWVAVASCVIGIPATVLMVMFVKERLYKAATKAHHKLGLWASMWATAKNRVFLRIFLLYLIVGFSMGLFGLIGTMLNIYWVMGSALAGAKLGAAVSMLAWVLGLLSLPAISWGCRRYQKHFVLGVALILMAIGTILKWWCFNPRHPEYQFILPFFFSVGIGSYYTVLSTLMADVTDYDELLTGTRREGMFGATMAFLIKIVGTLTPVLAGAILVLSGFDPALEYNQTPRTILNMRLMFSIVPGTMLLTGLLVLWRYPLTRQRMEEIKAELARRRAAAAV